MIMIHKNLIQKAYNSLVEKKRDKIKKRKQYQPLSTINTKNATTTII